MRVTQSMLSNNMLRNLSTSYNNMGKLQDQLNTGKKVNRPSDDPVVAMKGMGYRMQVDKVAQYQRNLGEVNNYLDSSDDALDKVGQAMHRAKELVTSAANGTMTPEDKEKVQSELDQLRKHIQDMANTKVGDKYIFSGTKTASPLHNGTDYETDPAFSKSVEIEVFDGVSLNVNTDAAALFKGIDDMFATFNTTTDFSAAIAQVDANMDKVLTTRADIGARQNRVEMMGNRLESQEASAKKQMSENEDIDYEKAITEMLTLESIHRAALSVGSRIIQPSLVDFLR
ncbi:flagellar hook-associated protein FlgL [Sporosarcina sp. E16_8]|uniref:flagellar hook-associated protein FlgL n=1 Tax=Sporosarcina sp. E16_8 TaxID=2789295 RepID=UPI001A92A149|nr:flagellar hook-associated protein FlgL [Sporosarcina sp. E16_8]MBO0589093.1 flagellar hook-associated protein FlgL [Sporosarcina sp. E16_8]